jgi:proton-dependent oligopeptide transporter, POT family
MFNKHPKGLLVLALANMGERFGYYTMLAILTLFMQAKFGLSSKETSLIYGTFLALVYFLPLFGGILADKVLGYGKTIFLGIIIMFGGYLLLSIPTGADETGKMFMFGALALIAIGTGCFKGNLQALVGNLYEDPKYSKYRDIAFSIFYMFINIGAFFAPSAANSINNAILAKDQYTYDAAIPTNYIKLNDKVVAEDVFYMDVVTKQHKTFETSKDEKQFLNKQKKKEGVIYPSDKEAALLKLKAAALTQEKVLTSKEYDIFNDQNIDSKNLQKSQILKKIHESNLKNDKTIEVWTQNYVNNSLSKSYNMAFGVACISLIISLLVFLGFRKTWKGVDKTLKQQLKEAKNDSTKEPIRQLSKEQTKERMIALFLVFFVVIFFWMSFHQNGLCMTYFARDYTTSNVFGVGIMMFNILSLIAFVAFVYGIYIATLGLFGGEKNVRNGIITSSLGLVGLIAVYYVKVHGVELMKITPQIFQQFNPFFIIILTPLSVALFSILNARGKEPSAPRKIGFGMLIAALGFIVLLIASLGLQSPSEIQGVSNVLVAPNWLIGTYFTLTIAELMLSPMGLSFVAKVAPPQYKGMMQGGWLAATAIGNYLVGVLGMLWDELSLWMFWSVLIICCLLSALFIFSIMKRLEKATNS